MLPMGTHLAEKGGFINDKIIAYYQRRACGGVGLIIVEQSAVAASGLAHYQQIRIDDDCYLPGYIRLVKAIHAEGARVAIQLNHAGRQTLPEFTGGKIYAPSAIPCPLLRIRPKSLPPEEIVELVKSFQSAAGRVKETGADALELQLGHGYLLCQFLSPFSNQRDDQYGQTPQGRFLMIKEVIEAIKSEVGNNSPILCRISADEMVEGGIRLKDSIAYVKMLEDLGVAAIDVSACNYASFYNNIPHYYLEEQPFVSYAEKIKQSAKIPVIAVGKIHQPEVIEKILNKSQVDLIGLGRQLIADPDFVKKLEYPGIGKIRRCLCCNQCFESIKGGSLQCTINPEIGYEHAIEKMVCKQKKRIVIVGAGPAGLTAADYLQQMGHSVTLFEKDQPGGQLRWAGKIPEKKHIQNWIDYLTSQLKGPGVEWKKGTEVTADDLKGGRFDEVVIATGSVPTIPLDVPVAYQKVIDYDDLFHDLHNLGPIIVVAGTGPQAAEIAEFLFAHQKMIILIEERRKIGYKLPSSIQYYLEKRIKESAWQIFLQATLREVKENKIILTRKGKEEVICGYDHIIFAYGKKSDQRFSSYLAENPQAKIIGDAKTVRSAKMACLDGFKIALEIAK